MAKSYIIDHLRVSQTDEEIGFMVELCHEHDDLVRARFSSRHSKNKNHTTTIQFDNQKQQPIEAWYCTCCAGAREVGMCSHITALLWHLGVNRATIPTDDHPLSASRLLNAIDDSAQFHEDEEQSDDDTLSPPVASDANSSDDDPS
jgi:hypothetical protein